MDNAKLKLRRKVARYIEDHGVPLGTVATGIGCSRQYLHSLMWGKAAPGTSIAVAIRDKFGIRVEEWSEFARPRRKRAVSS